jgi:hypothetical protein
VACWMVQWSDAYPFRAIGVFWCFLQVSLNGLVGSPRWFGIQPTKPCPL